MLDSIYLQFESMTLFCLTAVLAGNQLTNGLDALLFTLVWGSLI